jgi:hypothetical protein
LALTSGGEFRAGVGSAADVIVVEASVPDTIRPALACP